MTELQLPIRRARPDDAGALAELINIAGEGLPLYLWESMAEADETAWDVGRRRAKRQKGGFSYKNAIVLEDDAKVVACLIGYPHPNEAKPIDFENTPAIFIPLEELEVLAPGTWYVNVLASYPEFRGKGYGTRLLSIGERLAADAGKIGLSIIVSDANTKARRLYERCGYRAIAERPMVKEGWQNGGERWVLLTKSLSPAQQTPRRRK